MFDGILLNGREETGGAVEERSRLGYLFLSYDIGTLSYKVDVNIIGSKCCLSTRHRIFTISCFQLATVFLPFKWHLKKINGCNAKSARVI